MMVRFTDWGMYDIVPMVDVQPLPRQFGNLPGNLLQHGRRDGGGQRPVPAALY